MNSQLPRLIIVANPCEGVQCPPHQICESYPYVIGVTVSFHRCVPCPDGFTGVTCQEAITQSMSPTTSLTTSPTTTVSMKYNSQYMG